MWTRSKKARFRFVGGADVRRQHTQHQRGETDQGQQAHGDHVAVLVEDNRFDATLGGVDANLSYPAPFRHGIVKKSKGVKEERSPADVSKDIACVDEHRQEDFGEQPGRSWNEVHYRRQSC